MLQYLFVLAFIAFFTYWLYTQIKEGVPKLKASLKKRIWEKIQPHFEKELRQYAKKEANRAYTDGVEKLLELRGADYERRGDCITVYTADNAVAMKIYNQSIVTPRSRKQGGVTVVASNKSTTNRPKTLDEINAELAMASSDGGY